MFPASIQNKSQRPRMSLLMPALLTTNLSDSTRNDTNKTDQHGQQQTFAFMQIDCEVVDTRLIYFKLDELPTNYMKIINQDYTMNDDPRQTGDSADKSFFNYYANTGLWINPLFLLCIFYSKCTDFLFFVNQQLV